MCYYRGRYFEEQFANVFGNYTHPFNCDIAPKFSPKGGKMGIFLFLKTCRQMFVSPLQPNVKNQKQVSINEIMNKQAVVCRYTYMPKGDKEFTHTQQHGLISMTDKDKNLHTVNTCYTPPMSKIKLLQTWLKSEKWFFSPLRENSSHQLKGRKHGRDFQNDTMI